MREQRVNMCRKVDHNGKVWPFMYRKRSPIITEGKQSKCRYRCRVDIKFDGGKISSSLQIAF